ncbi:hypothetical protein QD228_16230 [Cobetia sp. 3AK]|uniref:hypothetical protein n=1 Tax=Cobetia sp. 3AK TaxID=3040020 RepID=UPI00244D23FA|nr:hypothetical protein [Cobetia sp. 3AK]MDH2375387.1 hypothetical protein [Cobetia sp. 3AK]
MNTIKTLIAAAALATVSTATYAADDSPAAQRVQQSVSQDVVVGIAQQAPTAQATFAETGKSVAAGRVETALTQSSIEGQGSATASREQAFDNDAGKSVAATRVQHALSDSNV